MPLLDVTLDCKGAPTLELAQQRYVPVGVTASASEPWVFPACFNVGDGQKSREVCAVVREAKQTLALGTGACPQWVVANRSGIGYYLPRLSPALYDALPKGERVLNGADYDPLLGDLSILARGGAVRYDVALRVAARQASNADSRAAMRAYALADAVPDALVDAANRPRYAAWIRHNFGDRARALGWLPRKGETADVLRLRERAVTTVAVRGQDVALARKAQQLAQRWVVHRSAIPPGTRRMVLVDRRAHVRQGRGRSYSRRSSRSRARPRTRTSARMRTARSAPSPTRRCSTGRWPRCSRATRAPATRSPRSSRRSATTRRAASHSRGLPVTAMRRCRACPARCRRRSPPGPTTRARRASAPCSSRRSRRALANAEGGARRYKVALERIDQCIALRRAQQGQFNAFLAR